MSNKTSAVWLHFESISDNKAKCVYCKSVFSSKGGSCSSNLRKHLLAKHPTVDIGTGGKFSRERVQNNDCVLVAESEGNCWSFRAF